MPVLEAAREHVIVSRTNRRQEEVAMEMPLPTHELRGVEPECLNYSPSDLRAYVAQYTRNPHVDLRNTSLFYNLRDAGIDTLACQLDDQSIRAGRKYQNQLVGAGYIACGIAVDLDPKLEWVDAASRLPNIKQVFPDNVRISDVLPEIGEMLGMLVQFANYKLFKSQSFGQLNAIITLCDQIKLEAPESESLINKTLQSVADIAERAIILLSEDLRTKPNYQFAPHLFMELKENLDLVIARCGPEVAKHKLLPLSELSKVEFHRVG